MRISAIQLYPTPPSATGLPGPPLSLFEKGKTYWVPNSHFAQDIIKSRLVFTVGRTPTPPADAVFLDVPAWYGKDEEE